jgi:hypothetical protein
MQKSQALKTKLCLKSAEFEPKTNAQKLFTLDVEFQWIVVVRVGGPESVNGAADPGVPGHQQHPHPGGLVEKRVVGRDLLQQHHGRRPPQKAHGSGCRGSSSSLAAPPTRRRHNISARDRVRDRSAPHCMGTPSAKAL